MNPTTKSTLFVLFGSLVLSCNAASVATPSHPLDQIQFLNASGRLDQSTHLSPDDMLVCAVLPKKAVEEMIAEQGKKETKATNVVVDKLKGLLADKKKGGETKVAAEAEKDASTVPVPKDTPLPAEAAPVGDHHEPAPLADTPKPVEVNTTQHHDVPGLEAAPVQDHPATPSSSAEPTSEHHEVTTPVEDHPATPASSPPVESHDSSASGSLSHHEIAPDVGSPAKDAPQPAHASFKEMAKTVSVLSSFVDTANAKKAAEEPKP